MASIPAIPLHQRLVIGPGLLTALLILSQTLPYHVNLHYCEAFKIPTVNYHRTSKNIAPSFQTSAEPSLCFNMATSSEEAETVSEKSDGFDFGNMLKPLQNFVSGLTDTSSTVSVPNDYDAPISEAKVVLNRAAETKKEDPELVMGALEDLEKLMRRKVKAEPETAAREVLENLNGDWRLVFTTGTRDTQKKLGAKINYFPIKAVQSFQVTEEPMRIQNGIYLGDFAIVRFFGDFEFNLKSSKLEFDFDQIAIAGFTINLGKGKAAEIGAASGLGSENNKDLVAKNKKPFFNWISADDTIATARGGGGGLALWKRVVTTETEA